MMAIIVLSVSTPVLSTSVVAQPACDAPTTSSWLRQPPNGQQDGTLAISRVHIVTRDVPAATNMLKDRSLVALTEGDSLRFAGPALAPNASTRTFRPYLVRAVFPTPNPMLTVRWNGNDLHVHATGLGCSPFTNHPLLVFLDREPAHVFVTASAAL